MTEATEVNSIVKGLPNPSLPNHLVNANYIDIKETHQILIEKVVLLDSALGGGGRTAALALSLRRSSTPASKWGYLKSCPTQAAHPLFPHV